MLSPMRYSELTQNSGKLGCATASPHDDNSAYSELFAWNVITLFSKPKSQTHRVNAFCVASALARYIDFGFRFVQIYDLRGIYAMIKGCRMIDCSFKCISINIEEGFMLPQAIFIRVLENCVYQTQRKTPYKLSYN